MKTIIVLFVCLFSLSSFAEGSKVSWDLGASIGSTNGENYTEGNLGINWHMTDWVTWRNSIFGRFYGNDMTSTGAELKDSYGLDTSLRLNHTFKFDENSSLRFFGGPGWRFASEAESPPFAEGGINIRLAGLNVGGGAKVIFNEVTDSNVPNDTQYFITLSGSGVIGGNSR